LFLLLLKLGAPVLPRSTVRHIKRLREFMKRGPWREGIVADEEYVIPGADFIWKRFFELAHSGVPLKECFSFEREALRNLLQGYLVRKDNSYVKLDDWAPGGYDFLCKMVYGVDNISFEYGMRKSAGYHIMFGKKMPAGFVIDWESDD